MDTYKLERRGRGARPALCKLKDDLYIAAFVILATWS